MAQKSEVFAKGCRAGMCYCFMEHHESYRKLPSGRTQDYQLIQYLVFFLDSGNILGHIKILKHKLILFISDFDLQQLIKIKYVSDEKKIK